LKKTPYEDHNPDIEGKGARRRLRSMAAMRDDISSGSDDLSLSTSDEESVGGEGEADDGNSMPRFAAFCSLVRTEVNSPEILVYAGDMVSFFKDSLVNQTVRSFLGSYWSNLLPSAL
jgi:hypothetical protein